MKDTTETEERRQRQKKGQGKQSTGKKASSAEKDIVARRKLAAEQVMVVSYEKEGKGSGKGGRRYAEIGNARPHTRTYDRSPAMGIAKSISEALDPQRRVRPFKTLADMTPEEREKILATATPPRQIKK